MSQFVAYSSNSSKNLDCVLARFADRLILPAVKSGGWGLGYYCGGDLLSRIEPRCSGEPLDTAAELDGIEAELFILHSREATVGSVRRENTHPFRFQNWSFAHNGTLEGFEGCRGRILEAMPPFIRRRINGDTDSEHLFHLMLSFLYDEGHINRPNPGTETIRRALAHAFAMADHCAGEEGHATSPASAVVSDGYSVVAMARGIPVHYAMVEGITSCENCRPSRVSESGPSPADHNDLRAVILRSGHLDEVPGGFHSLKDGTIISVTQDQRVEFDAIG